MAELTKILLKIDSNDAVAVADRYISFKYIELFCCIGFLGVLFLAIVIIIGFCIYKD